MICTLSGSPFPGRQSTCCFRCHAASLHSSSKEQRSAWHVIHYRALRCVLFCSAVVSCSLFRLLNRFSLLGFKFLVSCRSVLLPCFGSEWCASRRQIANLAVRPVPFFPPGFFFFIFYFISVLPSLLPSSRLSILHLQDERCFSRGNRCLIREATRRTRSSFLRPLFFAHSLSPARVFPMLQADRFLLHACCCQTSGDSDALRRRRSRRR